MRTFSTILKSVFSFIEEQENLKTFANNEEVLYLFGFLAEQESLKIFANIEKVFLRFSFCCGTREFEDICKY